MYHPPSVPSLLEQVSVGRGGRVLKPGEGSAGFDLATIGPNGEDFSTLTFGTRQYVEVAASKITWVKGGSVERSEDGKKLTVNLHSL